MDKTKKELKSRKGPSLRGVGEDIQHHIVYLTHGEKHFLEETYFSILSLCNQPSEIPYHLHVYTDQPKFFAPLGPLKIHFHTLDQEKITVWKGEHQFIHRLKIEVLIDLYKTFPGETYLFLDSDTYVSKPIDSVIQKIKPNRFVLDYDEGLLTQKKGDRTLRSCINFY